MAQGSPIGARRFTQPLQNMTPRLRHGLVGGATWLACYTVAMAVAEPGTAIEFTDLLSIATTSTVAYAVMGDGRLRVRFGGWHSVTHLVAGSLLATVCGAVLLGTLGSGVSWAPLLLTAWLAAGTIGALRWLYRHDRWSGSNLRSTRVVIFGAGTGGQLALQAIAADPAGQYRPVAVLDDDPSLHGHRIEGIRVVGGREMLGGLAERTQMMVIAVPSADGPAVSELFDLGKGHGLEVRALPANRDLFDRQKVELGEIREIIDSDLLGRHRIETDIESVAGYLSSRRVLVTGAGGSIGSELCRQLDKFDLERLIMLDRDESALHAVQLSIDGQAQLDTENLVLADIRDRNRMEQVFAHHRPDVVFHAAALKHLPLLERYPGEALLTNVQATVIVLELASRFQVDRFVNVSSDKAANPISVLGYSKRLSERLTASFAQGPSRHFMSVRFGNVLGSRGSVLTSFREQILAGNPLTITHPNVARYFMTVEEAVELVIQAGAIGDKGDVMVLDMGDPVKIVDVARRLAAQAGQTPEIIYTTLRTGEKLVEDLFGHGEEPRSTAHEKISATTVPPLAPLHVDRLNASAPPEATIDSLLRLCYLDTGHPTPPSRYELAGTAKLTGDSLELPDPGETI